MKNQFLHNLYVTERNRRLYQVEQWVIHPSTRRKDGTRMCNRGAVKKSKRCHNRTLQTNQKVPLGRVTVTRHP